ncbi:MAG: transposase, partial [Acidimicrobiia bacterium]|nr:transposase [Acidimicrobiia bacterium]
MNRIPDIDRLDVRFDEGSLVADAGLLVAASLLARLGLERLVDDTVRMDGRPGGARPGRKVLSLVASMLLGGTHIDHADRLRSGATHRVLPFRVMAPSTLGTFLRSFTWGHVCQLNKALGALLKRVWSLPGAGPGDQPLVIDVDSTICEVSGKSKEGACYGHTRQLGYHPLIAARADTGEIVHHRLRKGSSQKGNTRFMVETVNRVRRAGATGPIT